MGRKVVVQDELRRITRRCVARGARGVPLARMDAEEPGRGDAVLDPETTTLKMWPYVATITG
jgi:hypothetical protein